MSGRGSRRTKRVRTLGAPAKHNYDDDAGANDDYSNDDQRLEDIQCTPRDSDDDGDDGGGHFMMS